MPPTRSASEGVNSLPRWRFGLVWNVPLFTAGNIARRRNPSLSGRPVDGFCMALNFVWLLIVKCSESGQVLAYQYGSSKFQLSPTNFAASFLAGYSAISGCPVTCSHA